MVVRIIEFRTNKHGNDKDLIKSSYHELVEGIFPGLNMTTTRKGRPCSVVWKRFMPKGGTLRGLFLLAKIFIQNRIAVTMR